MELSSIKYQGSFYNINKIPVCELRQVQNKFKSEGFLNITSYFDKDLIKKMREDAELIANKHRVRRELIIEETGHTPRRMFNVRRSDIFQEASIIPMVYVAPDMLALLSRIANDNVKPLVWEEEQYLINELQESGDTHGWHWDDYPYAVVFVLETPSYTNGGFVQCIPNTYWDKASPNVENYINNYSVENHYLRSGEVYFLRSNTTLHRVAPLVQPGRRLIINMSWDGDKSIANVEHSTMDQLYA